MTYEGLDPSHIRVERDGATPFGAVWIVHAPWAHQGWQDYYVSLADITTPGVRPVIKCRDDVTHEVLVYAIIPNREIMTGVNREDWSIPRFVDANHGYQFAAGNDDEAYDRIASIVQDIELGRLSPDTDYKRDWDRIFADGITLRRRLGSYLGEAIASGDAESTAQ